jgi:hypothetical protein
LAPPREMTALFVSVCPDARDRVASAFLLWAPSLHRHRLEALLLPVILSSLLLLSSLPASNFHANLGNTHEKKMPEYVLCLR